MESEGEDGKVRTEHVVWTWRVHEIALHEAGQREGVLMIGNSKEALLKKISEEVTRKAQEKLSASRSSGKS
jgi:hypothetical protein